MNVTAVVVAMTVLPALFIGLDIVLALDKRDGNTYSEILRAAGRRCLPLVILMSFGVGLLLAHWFWSPVDVVQLPCPKT